MDGLQLSPETLAALQSFRTQQQQPSISIINDNNNNSNNSNNNTTTNTTNTNEKKEEEEEEDTIIASDNKLYKTKEYWNERFQKEVSYDWLLTYQEIKLSILKYLNPNQRILIIGCGNSNFSSELYDDGFHNIVNIDFSQVVIERMKELNQTIRSEMTWLEMDMCELTFENNIFDVIIDKASMDALLVDEGSVWDPNESVISSVDKMCQEMSRVLSPNGIFLQISFAQPHFRTKYLMGEHIQQTVTSHYTPSLGYCYNYQWRLSVENISRNSGCVETFLYIMKKGEEEED